MDGEGEDCPVGGMVSPTTSLQEVPPTIASGPFAPKRSLTLVVLSVVGLTGPGGDGGVSGLLFSSHPSRDPMNRSDVHRGGFSVGGDDKRGDSAKLNLKTMNGGSQN